MLSQHQNKAFVGLGCWLASLVGFIALISTSRPEPQSETRSSSDFFGILIVAALFVQFFLYLWGAYHLAKGKGQPEVLILLGLLCFVGQLVALAVFLALPDKNPQRSPKNSSRRRKKPHMSGIAFVISCRRKLCSEYRSESLEFFAAFPSFSGQADFQLTRQTFE